MNIKTDCFINDSFRLNNGNVTKIDTKAVYGNNDAFYEAKGSYSLFLRVIHGRIKR